MQISAWWHEELPLPYTGPEASPSVAGGGEFTQHNMK